MRGPGISTELEQQIGNLRWGSASDVGRVRGHNEDSLIVLPDFGVWGVADGMGGHAGGEIASNAVVEAVARSLNQGHELLEAIHQADQHIRELTLNGEGKPGMGSTVVLARFDDTSYELAWVGDSRAYSWDGDLRMLTRDHTYVQGLVDSGAISEEEARGHPGRNMLQRALIANGDTEQAEADWVTGTLKPGSTLLFCSDGLTDEVSEDEIAKTLEQAADPQDAADRLVEQAVKAGGRDNVSVVVVQYLA